MILRQQGQTTVIGVVVGLAAALMGSRLLESFVFDVSVRDPVTYLFAAVLLAAVGLLASYVPARRAARFDPVTTLRE